MMENRPRIQIVRNTLSSEKSPPPTKLLINHGKPNFTINKSKSTNQQKCSPPIVSAVEQPPIFTNHLKPSEMQKRLSPNKIVVANGSDEFFRLHEKIGGKNFDEIEYQNAKNLTENGNTDNIVFCKINSPKDKHFPTLQKTGILTFQHQENGNGIHYPDVIENGGDNDLMTNGKSTTPERSRHARIFDRISPNRSPSPAALQNSNYGQSTESVNSNASSGPNFEQKTIVSFSKDLCTTPNRYPDTVKTTKLVEIEGSLPMEFSNLKFEIGSDGNVVMPIKKGVA